MERIDYSLPPIAFINQLVSRHQRFLQRRPSSGEALRYMREAVDQVGRGAEFIRFYVHNPEPSNQDPEDPRNDLALLHLYEHWRETNNWQQIEPWDGSRLRPWLPAENNPRVPDLLKGDLAHFHDAWSRFNPSGTSPDPYKWDAIDAFGLEVETYFSEVRSHSTWSRPIGGGKLRFYRFNELNNIEMAPYSIRFWGFFKWVDFLRRILLNDKSAEKELRGAQSGDIAFMDEFNINHFTWHDDVFDNGHCPDIFDQFGRRQRHKYMMNTHGYAIEFMEFHGDVIKSYNKRMQEIGMPPTTDWVPDQYNSAHILKLAFGGPWGLGNSNGDILPIEKYAPELVEEGLPSFKTGAELGFYLENCGITWHGMGHVQNCDIRDVYTNNYSIRFFGWHQWIDGLYRRILSDRPKYDKNLPFEVPVPDFCKGKAVIPEIANPYEGAWTYRSFKNVGDPDEDPKWFVATMRLQEGDGLSSRGRPSGVVKGELDSGHPDYRYRLAGYLDKNNIQYEIKPPEHDERMILVMRAEGMTEATRGHVYEYRGYYQVPWSRGRDQTPTFSGSMMRSVRPDDPSLEGTVGTFHSVAKAERQKRIFVDSLFPIPEGVTKLTIRAWGAGGGGGSDGPGVGGVNGADGGDTVVATADASSIPNQIWRWDGVNGWIVDRPWREKLSTLAAEPLLYAGGGRGGEHGVMRAAKGGAGGVARSGQDNVPGESGEDANNVDGISGRGGNAPEAGSAGLGGLGVAPESHGENGLFPGGGGSGAQLAHTPGGGGGSGAFSSAVLDVQPGQTLVIQIGQGGAGGDDGSVRGGTGSDGLVTISW